MSSLPATPHLAGSVVPPVEAVSFSSLLQQDLGENWGRAFKVFCQYADGPCASELSHAVTTVLAVSVRCGMVPAVLDELERHWKDDLGFKPPEVFQRYRRNLDEPLTPTAQLFIRLYLDVLAI